MDRRFFCAALALLILAAGVRPSYALSSKRYKKAKAKITQLESNNGALNDELNECRDSASLMAEKIASLEQKIELMNMRLQDQKKTNEQVVNHMKDLSVISGNQAESINKFLESMGAKDAYIKDLQQAIARKDSLNLALVMNLKSAVGNLDDQDINIKIDKGVVYIDISDKMLFKTGQFEVTERAREVLGKVAKVLLAHPEIEFMVEGHTDDIPFRESVLLDNWDLSVKRATSVVRVLQNDYHMQPARITAAGRGEYVPVASNSTDAGRALNRRTRIVILPQLDQFFQLLEKNSAH